MCNNCGHDNGDDVQLQYLRRYLSAQQERLATHPCDETAAEELRKAKELLAAMEGRN
jgi:DNA-binding transcriptional regulator LsrR (DeoR family)